MTERATARADGTAGNLSVARRAPDATRATGHRPTPPARPRWRAVLAAGLVGLALLAPTPGLADHDQELHLEVVKPPERPKDPLLDRLIPGLPEFRRDLPPFLRDTDLKLHLRSFYFNREKSDGSYSEAWALGGWLQYQSGWLFDTFAVGAVGYTSLPAYAPDDRPGSTLLTPGQDAITVLGEAWAALRYKEYALLKGYRQRIDTGYVNPQDNRMIPNTFEAVTLGGHVDWFRYDVGYLWRIKPRDSNDFISMSSQAGAPGSDEGLILTAITLTPIKDLVLYGGNYYVPNVFNTAFGKAEYKFPITTDLALQVGLQFTDQRGVGDDRIGNFATWNVGAGARLLWRGLTFGVATHFTGDDANISSPYGSWPGYLSLQVTDFDRANEKAFGIGLKYDFGGTLLPFQVPGLSVHLLYAQGNDQVNPATGGDLPTTREGDFDVIYNAPFLKPLQFRFRAAFVDQGGPKLVKDFRIIINYEFDLL